MDFKEALKKTWDFIWHDNSIWSWIANVILAFLLVRFVIYPVIGLLLSTSYPVVAVVSGSMEHDGLDFEAWWASNHKWYDDHGITKDSFKDYSFSNGFNKGDIMILKGVEPKAIKAGDVVVYETSRNSNPIIHRVVGISEENGKLFFATKGDNNMVVDPGSVSEEQISSTGKAVAKIPWLGWLRILLVDMMRGGQ